jgi:hypothetical protein
MLADGSTLQHPKPRAGFQRLDSTPLDGARSAPVSVDLRIPGGGAIPPRRATPPIEIPG